MHVIFDTLYPLIKGNSMGVVNYPSASEFQKAFDAGLIGGLIPLTLAGASLDLSRARLTAIAGEGDDLVLVKVKVGDTMINGVTEDSFRSFYAKRAERELLLAAANENTLHQHIIDSLLKNGFADDRRQLLEYGAHIMKPFGLSHQLARDRQHIGALLGTISEATFEDPNCGALLSAVVINKTGPNKGKPSGGFWNLVESVTGKSVDESNREAYWREEIEKLQAYIARVASGLKSDEASARRGAPSASPSVNSGPDMDDENFQGVILPNPSQMLEGELDIGDEGHALAVKSFIYRGDSIAFHFQTNVFGANQMISVDGVARLDVDDDGVFKSGLLAPKQVGSDGKDLYRVRITIKRAVAMSEDNVSVKGTWELIRIHGAEAFETFEFEGELTFKAWATGI